jgi:hypothetical protein
MRRIQPGSMLKSSRMRDPSWLLLIFVFIGLITQTNGPILIPYPAKTQTETIGISPPMEQLPQDRRRSTDDELIFPLTPQARNHGFNEEFIRI